MKIKLRIFYNELLYYIGLVFRLIKPKVSELEKIIKDNLTKETYFHFRENFEKSTLFKSEIQTREYAIKNSLLNDKNNEYYYLEFGVYKGDSSNFFSNYVKKLYAFDGFEGFKDDWVGTDITKGNLNLKKKVPKLNHNVIPVIGWVEDTLDDFLSENKPKLNFVHLDMDTYSSTKFTLLKLKPFLLKNSIIIFDQFYNFPGWKFGEFKAFTEVFKEDEFKYKAFNLRGKQVVIEIN